MKHDNHLFIYFSHPWQWLVSAWFTHPKTQSGYVYQYHTSSSPSPSSSTSLQELPQPIICILLLLSHTNWLHLLFYYIHCISSILLVLQASCIFLAWFTFIKRAHLLRCPRGPLKTIKGFLIDIIKQRDAAAEKVTLGVVNTRFAHMLLRFVHRCDERPQICWEGRCHSHPLSLQGSADIWLWLFAILQPGCRGVQNKSIDEIALGNFTLAGTKKTPKKTLNLTSVS